MATEWGRTTIGEVAERVAMGPFGSSIKVSTFVENGIPVISGQHLRGSRLEDNEFNFVSEEHADSLRNANVFRGDVVFTHAGNIGQCAYIPETSKYRRYVLSQRQFYMRCDKTKVLPEFVTCFFKSAEGRHALLANASQTGVPSIARPVTYVRTIEIPFPPLAEQKAIASILGALDDKIELDRRMNATLEAMARALFQSWFVDFLPVRAKQRARTQTGDPVRPPAEASARAGAKLDGRQSAGLDEATALPAPQSEATRQAGALFPSGFLDSDAGRIPTGWTTGKVENLCRFSRTAVNPGESPTEMFDHFSLPAFDGGRTPKPELGGDIKSNKLVVSPDAVLLSKLNPHIPRIWLPDLHPARRSICSTEFIVACPKDGMSREYLYSLFTSAAFASTYGTLVTGTTGSHQRISHESVSQMEVVVPPPPLIHAFTALAKPMFDQANRNIEQSRTLATLRDTLLPKLLSGELRVPDAAAIAGQMA